MFHLTELLRPGNGILCISSWSVGSRYYDMEWYYFYYIHNTPIRCGAAVICCVLVSG